VKTNWVSLAVVVVVDSVTMRSSGRLAGASAAALSLLTNKMSEPNRQQECRE
jgi:hypothetical protein